MHHSEIGDYLASAMQIQRLQELLQNPELISGDDRIGLKAWSEKYPYAASISMLLARASAEGGHMNAEQDLLQAASHGTFRQPLFDLMLRTRLREEAAEVDKLVDQFDVSVASETETDLADDGATPRLLDPEHPLEREALISAIGRTIETEVEEWDDVPKPSKATDTSPNDDLILIRKAVASPFANWLSQRASDVGFGEVIDVRSSTEQAKPLDARSLIDRFIAAQPKMGKMREVDSSVEQWAKESVMEDPTLVTETMARIYAKQGKIGKARKAYRLLALKYPAKSTYFASQLEKLGQTEEGSADSNE